MISFKVIHRGKFLSNNTAKADPKDTSPQTKMIPSFPPSLCLFACGSICSLLPPLLSFPSCCHCPLLPSLGAVKRHQPTKQPTNQPRKRATSRQTPQGGGRASGISAIKVGRCKSLGRFERSISFLMESYDSNWKNLPLEYFNGLQPCNQLR